MIVLPTVLATLSFSMADASAPARMATLEAASFSAPASHSQNAVVAGRDSRGAKSLFDRFAFDTRPSRKAQLGVAPPSGRGRSLPEKVSALAATDEESSTERNPFLCPPDMAMIGHKFCVDLYEASLLEVLATGAEQPWSPFYPPAEGHKVRAVSKAGVFPQGYISGEQAAEACKNSGKRLCKPDEWKKACMGPKETFYPYGNENQPKRCNDTGRSPMQFFHQISDKPEDHYKWGMNGNMMDPRLNQLEGGLAKTGEFAACTNEYGVYDMVGNLHEWVDDPYGTFQGGYYLDTHLNADGCYYRTTAHAFSHSDYSTGFRCCADVEDP